MCFVMLSLLLTKQSPWDCDPSITTSSSQASAARREGSLPGKRGGTASVSVTAGPEGTDTHGLEKATLPGQALSPPGPPPLASHALNLGESLRSGPSLHVGGFRD